MIDGPYATQPSASTFDDRDARDRRDDYPTQAYAQPHPGSPPQSASPFAFAPPPLSSLPGSSSRPVLSMHQSSEATAASQDYSSYYAQRGGPQTMPLAASANSAYATYSGSHPMGYRSVSGEQNAATRAAPPASLSRGPSFSVVSQAGAGGQPSPTATSAYYPPPPRPAAQAVYSGAQHSPRATSVYAPQSYYTNAYGQPAAVDMPRSLSYPNGYATPYTNYLPSMSTPALVQHSGEAGSLPPLVRHGSANSIPGVGGQAPALGYAFTNRLPLVDRPFKCDQCVQSFNRNHDLKRHKRIHLSVKPYGCEKCGKTFSRKDALRRHWMVRGCRGEEGATAPITPTYPLNGPVPPALSPATPPTNGTTENGNGNSSSNNNTGSTTAISSSNNTPSSGYGSNPMSFSHPSAPPPLSSLPPRQSSDQSSQIILTPNDQRQTGADSSASDNVPGLNEPVVIDPALSNMDNTPSGESERGYFDGSVVRKESVGVPDSATSSTFSRYGASPKDDLRHHPYKRTPLPSPSAHGPTSIGPDGKPVFTMPFAHTSGGLLAPIESAEDGHHRGGHGPDSGNINWSRWQREVYPFQATSPQSANVATADVIHLHGLGPNQPFTA